MTSTLGAVNGSPASAGYVSLRGPLKLVAAGATPSRLGIKFNTSLRFEDWQALGVRLGTHVNSSMWWLGDWLDFGREMYGQRYRLGVALSGLEYKTLRNYAYVARRVPLSRRRDSLSFHHHAEVAALPPDDQELWLDRAENGGWTRSKLRSQLRTELVQGSASYVTVSLHVAPTHRWCEAASRCGCELQSWIQATLDEAASEILER